MTANETPKSASSDKGSDEKKPPRRRIPRWMAIAAVPLACLLAGGAIGATAHFLGRSKAEVRERLDGIADTVATVIELAERDGVPIGGKDFKTGQTLMKTILAPGLQARALGIRGWFSSNILGNRDGLVLDHPDNFRTKEVSKLSVLDDILRPDLNPELYGGIYHKVRINYYPPHGDNKESWDNIDIFGWLGERMQIKVDFLCLSLIHI